jgi:hypothetical protein
MRSGLGGRGLEEVTNWACKTYMHGNNTRKLPETPCFSFFVFYVFSSTKSENRREEQVLHPT